MKTQHTQGFWKFLYDDRRDNYQIYADKIWIATTKGGACSNSQESNARLIASAPLLLEALEWCEQVYGSDWPENASIRETIKKARGES